MSESHGDVVAVGNGRWPVRTCLVCGGKAAKKELVRLALDGKTGCVVVDPRQVLHGRGGYACPACLGKLQFNRRVQRAFRNGARGLCLNHDS